MLKWGGNATWWAGISYCLAAILLDWLSNIGLYSGIGVTPWNPASGLALAFAYVYDRKAIPFIVVSEALVLIIANRAAFPVPWIIILTMTSSAISIGAGAVLRALPDFHPRLGTLPALLCLIAVALIQSALLSLTYGAGLWFSAMIDQATLSPISWRLIVGHVVGIVIVAPLPMMLSAGWRWPRPSALRTIQILVMIGAIWVVFSYRAASTYQLFYLLFLPLLWVALRDGVGGAAIILNVAQLGIIAGAQFRTDLVPGTGSLQVLMIALALTGLLVGAVVTDRQAAGQRLRDQHAALARVLRLRSAGETAAAISHQINQPITAISTYALVAREALESNDLALARSSLDSLTRECDRAAAVARSIRDLVKQGSLSKEPVRLQDLVAGLQAAHAMECTSLDVHLDIDIPGGLPNIPADRIQLEQALDNLLSNSIEAIREAGKGESIKISAAIEGGDVLIDVEDDGPGFAPGLDAIATTPFMTTKLNGSGLGLAIARSVAEAHGGSLAVLQRNTGACVHLRLPTTRKQDV